MGCGALAVVAVILGNYQNIRQFHDAPLDALEIVSGAGDEQEHENVHHGAHRSFRLADPHGFNENNVKARGFACNHGFTRFPGYASQRAAGGGRADEGVFFSGEFLHACFVSHNGTAGD